MCVLLAALYNDYANEDIPDVDPSDYLTASEEPAAEPSVSPSPCPVPPPDDGMRPGRSRYDGQSLDWPPKDNHYPTPPPAPRKDQTPLSSSEWDSGSDYCEGCPTPQGPLKILRSGSLFLHKSCGGPLPIGYVGTAEPRRAQAPRCGTNAPRIRRGTCAEQPRHAGAVAQSHSGVAPRAGTAEPPAVRMSRARGRRAPAQGPRRRGRRRNARQRRAQARRNRRAAARAGA